VPAGGTSGIPAASAAALPLTRPSERRAVRPTAADARLLFPNIGYRQQLPTVVYTMLFSSLNSDLGTIHRMRIFTEGGPEAVDIARVERTRFRNPETGIMYVARRYGARPGARRRGASTAASRRA
jgi:hypothetical protein